MHSAQHAFDYKGHHIAIDLQSVGDRWHWSYRIGDSSPYELSDVGESSEERARDYAERDAKGRIDGMARTQS